MTVGERRARAGAGAVAGAGAGSAAARTWAVAVCLGAAALLALALAPAAARADGVSCDAKLRAQSEQTAADGAALEQQGKLVEAFVHYRSAGEYCDLAAAKEGLKRAGKALGAAAEKAGRAYGDDRFRGWWESAPGCLGKATPECVKPAELEELRRGSAIAWYEYSGNPAEADRVMLAHAKAHGEDLTVFRKAWSHFQERDRAGALDQPRPGTPRAELQRLAQARATKLLELEQREFAKGADLMSGNVERAVGLLAEGEKWLESAVLPVTPVKARALQHGEARMRGASVSELGEAKRFFEFADDDAKEAQLRAKARGEGEKALSANQRMLAVQYFTLSGDDDRAQAAMPKVDPASMPKPDPEKVKKLQKTDAEKEKFRKEQADLEKELGL